MYTRIHTRVCAHAINRFPIPRILRPVRRCLAMHDVVVVAVVVFVRYCIYAVARAVVMCTERELAQLCVSAVEAHTMRAVAFCVDDFSANSADFLEIIADRRSIGTRAIILS